MDPSLSSRFLDPKAISHAETLGMNARFLVEGYMAGEHKSPYHGFATEFAQHREYAPGDDIRHLDWKVLGRTDRYYIKQYEQETNFVAHILVDGSESMKYGSGSVTKFDYARVLAACLSYLIFLQRDAVAFDIFDTTTRDYIPRSNSRSTLFPIMSRLAAMEPTQGTNIAGVLHEMARQIRRKGLVFLISDLLDDEEKILEGIQHLRFGGSEVIVLHTMDPYELDFPFRGLVEFIGLENIPKILTRPNEIRDSYLAELEAFRRRLREGCEKNQCHYLLVNTGQPLHEVLSAYLAFRARTTMR
jgi:uncharacterized protein (DUF58 family)